MIKYRIVWATRQEWQQGTPQHITLHGVSHAEALDKFESHKVQSMVNDLSVKDRREWHSIVQLDASGSVIAQFTTNTPFHPLPTAYPPPMSFNDTWEAIYAAIP